MKRHTIELKDFQNYVGSVELAASYGKDSNKKLTVQVTIGANHVTAQFRVYADKQCRFIGSQLDAAMEAYNELP